MNSDLTSSVTPCEFSEPTLLPPGCAYETCIVPGWGVDSINHRCHVPECTVTYTWYPGPTYEPKPYPWTSTGYENGSPVVSIINNISINIVTPTGAIWVPGGSSTSQPSPSPTSESFALFDNHGHVAVVQTGKIIFVTLDAAQNSPHTFSLVNGDLTDGNGHIAHIDTTLIETPGSPVFITSSLGRMLVRRAADNSTVPANGTLSWSFSGNVLNAYYGDQLCNMSECPPDEEWKLSLSSDPGSCT